MKRVAFLALPGLAALILTAGACQPSATSPPEGGTASPTPTAPTTAKPTTPKPAVADADPDPIVRPPDPVSASSAELTVFHIEKEGDGAHLVAQKIPVGKDDSVTKRAEAAINRMAALESSPLPKGTKALSVTFEGDLAIVDLSEEFKSNFSGGSTDEALAINSVTATMAQFPGVKRVQFLVAGQKIEALGGGQELSDPIPVPQPAGT